MQVEVISSRPPLADRLFSGKAPAEAAERAGRVFTLCGRAQRLAATAACAAAQSNYSSLIVKPPRRYAPPLLIQEGE